MSRNACNGENGETGEKSPAAGDLNWMPKVAPWRCTKLIQLVYMRHSSQILRNKYRSENPNWQEATKLAIYKRGRGFDLQVGRLRTIPASGQLMRDSNPGPPDCETDALTTNLAARSLLNTRCWFLLSKTVEKSQIH